ncbi:radial spoke head 14 homolog [Xenentodon cancila]
MAGAVGDPTRAPVPFGRLAVPQLFQRLQQPQTEDKLPVLVSLCDVLVEPERIYQTVNGGFLEQLRSLLKDEDPAVRAKTCELLHMLTVLSIGRQALLASSLLPRLSELLDDSSTSCRRNVQHVLHRLALQPAGAAAVLSLVPVLMQKLEREEEEEVQTLLLSTISRCCRFNALPCLASDGVSVLGRRLSHRSADVRREAAAALMALSVDVAGKRQVCEERLLPVLVGLLQDEDPDVQVNAAGVIMYTAVITEGKRQCLDLDVVPVLLELLSEEEEDSKRRRRKALVLFSLRALTALAEAPEGRRLLLQQLPLLVRKTEADEDPDVRRAAGTAVRVVSWTP